MMKKIILLLASLIFYANSCFAAISFAGDTTNGGLINCGSASSLTLSGPNSFSWWMNVTDSGNSGAGRILDKGQRTINISGSQSLTWDVSCNTTDITVRTSNSTVSLGTWQHWVLTWDGTLTATNTHIYINGVETTYQTQTNGSSSASSDSASSAIIGNRSAGDRTFNGTITEFAVFSKVLSTTEIKQLYGGGTVPKYIPNSIDRTKLILYLPMDEKTSGTVPATTSQVRDWSEKGSHGTKTNSPTYASEPTNLPYRTQRFTSTNYTQTDY